MATTPTSSDIAVRFQDHLQDAEFQVEVIANQGMGAAAMRVEAVRRIFSRCWFNESTAEAMRTLRSLSERSPAEIFD